MKFLQVIVTVIFIAPIVAILTYSNHDMIKSIIDPPREKIRSVIHIGETCGVGTDYFEIVDLDTGHRVPVRNGKSRIETTEGNKIQLQISAQFQDVVWRNTGGVGPYRISIYVIFTTLKKRWDRMNT